MENQRPESALSRSDQLLETPSAPMPKRRIRLPVRTLPSNRRRLKCPGDGPFHHYITSRMLDGQPVLDEVEKEMLVLMLHQSAAFHGIDVHAYAVLGNHYHALVAVPEPGKWLARFRGPAGEEAFFTHLGLHYPAETTRRLCATIAAMRADGRAAEAEELITSLHRRFCDPGIWTKELKENFSKWLNKRRGHRGYVWFSRFKDTLVQEGAALLAVSLYIDLNPVRSGLVDDPAGYRWCGYAAAHAGDPAACDGLLAALGRPGGQWDAALADYRAMLRQAIDGQAKPHGERLPLLAALGRPMPQMGDGLAIGEADWLERVFTANRALFGRYRRTGARPIFGVETTLCTLRDKPRQR